MASMARAAAWVSERRQLSKRESVATLLEATDNDAGLCTAHFRRALFRGHPYARSVLGTRRSIEAAEQAQVVERYRAGLARRARSVLDLTLRPRGWCHGTAVGFPSLERDGGERAVVDAMCESE